MTHDGGMNPDFGLVDIVPDEDLNTRLKFYVSPCFLLEMKNQSNKIISVLIYSTHNWLLQIRRPFSTKTNKP